MKVKINFARCLDRPPLIIDNAIRLEMNKSGELIVINKQVKQIPFDVQHLRYISVYNAGRCLYKIQL